MILNLLIYLQLAIIKWFDLLTGKNLIDESNEELKVDYIKTQSEK